jgi:hypothetical protein
MECTYVDKHNSDLNQLLITKCHNILSQYSTIHYAMPHSTFSNKISTYGTVLTTEITYGWTENKWCNEGFKTHVGYLFLRICQLYLSCHKKCGQY